MMWTHPHHPFHLRRENQKIGRMSWLPKFREALAGIKNRERDREPIGALSDHGSLNIVKEVSNSGLLEML